VIFKFKQDCLLKKQRNFQKIVALFYNFQVKIAPSISENFREILFFGSQVKNRKLREKTCFKFIKLDLVLNFFQKRFENFGSVGLKATPSTSKEFRECE